MIAQILTMIPAMSQWGYCNLPRFGSLWWVLWQQSINIEPIFRQSHTSHKDHIVTWVHCLRNQVGTGWTMKNYAVFQPVTLGSRGHWSNLSSVTESPSLAADTILPSSAESAGQSSRVTRPIFTGPDPKTSSSGTSSAPLSLVLHWSLANSLTWFNFCWNIWWTHQQQFFFRRCKTGMAIINPASRKNLCRNLVTPSCFTKDRFTSLAVLPSMSAASSTATSSPEQRKHTSMGAETFLCRNAGNCRHNSWRTVG